MSGNDAVAYIPPRTRIPSLDSVVEKKETAISTGLFFLINQPNLPIKVERGQERSNVGTIFEFHPV